MREAARRHGPALTGFVVMLLVFSGFLVGFRSSAPAEAATPFRPSASIDLPGPGEDEDNDTYADAFDIWDGDLVLRANITDLRLEGAEAPYLLVGTQQDGGRTGRGAELEWLHVVDHDPLGHPPGSEAWRNDALRTGAWVRLAIDVAPSAHRPLVVPLDVRDDDAAPVVEIEAWDAGPSPHRRLGAWTLTAQVPLQADPERIHDVGGGIRRLVDGGAELSVRLEAATGLGRDVAQAIAGRWAPILLFGAEERFFPTRAEAMEQFHGFAVREPDLRTWTPSFNNGRDTYLLLLADFTGDRVVDHGDAAVMYDVLRAGGIAAPTVYAHVAEAPGGRVVVQYWFIYMYNFVRDVQGEDVQALAHQGDREFMQLVFVDEDAARNGTPSSVAYSQHYHGVAFDYVPGGPPFHLDPQHPAVYVAQGSHASYPVAGDDARLRSPLASYGDEFPGDGETLRPGDYALELLGGQPWHAGHLWGPATRFTRDLGTSTKPLLQHDFRYPYLEPLHWQSSLRQEEAEGLFDLYRTGLTEDGH